MLYKSKYLFRKHEKICENRSQGFYQVNHSFHSLGGSGPVIWSYFAEFQPKSRRGSMLSFMAAFWTIGNLFVAGLAWLIIPSGNFIHSTSSFFLFFIVFKSKNITFSFLHNRHWIHHGILHI